MTNYLIRRIFQMIAGHLRWRLSSSTSCSISRPAGRWPGIQQQQRRMTREDLARLRAQYELDLYWPVRFSRWLVGVPERPDHRRRPRAVCQGSPVGCYLPRYEANSGGLQPKVVGCDDYVYLSELPKLHPAAQVEPRHPARRLRPLDRHPARPAGHRPARQPARRHAATDDHLAAAFAADRRAHRDLQRGQAVLHVRLLLHDRRLHRLGHADLLLRAAADPGVLGLPGLPGRHRPLDPAPAAGAARGRAPL